MADLPTGRRVFLPYFSSMFTVYVLRSQKREYWYVGLTANLERRVTEHQDGRERTTKPYRPFDLVHTENFTTRPEARKREKYLKSGSGKEWLKTPAGVAKWQTHQP